MASSAFNYGGPPPGQGHYPSHPGENHADDRYDDRGRPPPPRQTAQRQSEPYFDPPPTQERGYPPSDYGPGPYDRPPPPHQQFADYSASPPPNRPHSERDRSRPYAPTDPGPHEFNQMAPYNADKAEAEWDRGVNEAYSHQRRARSRDYDERSMYDDRYDDDRDYSYGGRDERDRRRRRNDYTRDSKRGNKKDFFGAGEGDRGFGAKLLGGAGGALIAHEATKGSYLKTISGALVGALVGDVAEKQYEKHRSEKALKNSRGQMEEPYAGRRDRDERYSDDEGRSRSRTRSRPGLRDRLKRSLSRARSKSIGRSRRSGSADSRDDETEYSQRDRGSTDGRRSRSRTRSRPGLRDRLQRSLSRARSKSKSRTRRADSADSYEGESEYSHRR